MLILYLSSWPLPVRRSRIHCLMTLRFLCLAFALGTCLYPQTPTTAEEIPPVRTSVTIFERIEQESPASITTLNKLDIAKAPGVNLDDRMRLVPGFSLFRRNSSITANPTTQGIS